MSDDEAYEAFCNLRWVNTDGQPEFLRCGCVGAYNMRTCKKFKCKAREYQHQFSVTSGTIFASRKLPVRDCLLAIVFFVNGAKGVRRASTEARSVRSVQDVFRPGSQNS